MAAPTPFALTPAIRFRPATTRSRSQSPSRSPIRKAQFAARELDPLLSNLSPDSTLKALQTTATITNGASDQDALAKSIAEATPAERELGIRAAVAAQKLREWYQEVSRWPWPTRRDRGWGAGFLPPSKSAGLPSAPTDVPHFGFLPSARVYDYEERIEDIRDGVEALELEDVKDHVFSAHVPERSVSAVQTSDQSPGVKPTGYGRMRDFTALITATIIQALPQLANLTLLLDTWEIRLSVLRQIPEITQSFRSTQAGIHAAFQVVRSQETGPLVTMEEYEVAKPILGGKVASLGSRIDKLLDMLEGQEDSLPKSWIDMLENIENQYAAWVVEAEHVAIRNDLLSKALAEQLNAERSQQKTDLDTSPRHVQPPQPAILVSETPEEDSPPRDPTDETPVAELASTEFFGNSAPSQQSLKKIDGTTKSPLKVSTNNSRHNRGVSEVSFADSTFSAMSDFSAAEIVDAKTTKVMASPKISVIDNPFRASRDELSWFSKPNAATTKDSRPPMLQRASTASIEVVSRNSVKQVNLTRSRSHDVLNDSALSGLERAGTPSQALQQLTGSTARGSPPLEDFRLDRLDPKGLASASKSPTISPSPSLRVEPLQIKGKELTSPVNKSPDLPRRSSKRLSQVLDVEDMSQSPLETNNPLESSSNSDDVIPTQVQPVVRPNESLEAKIKDILNTIPTKVRLAKDYEPDEAQVSSSASSTRSSTPAPSLTLSPVKTDRSSRQAMPGDVRMFHLTRAGQARDTPPVKLFVRAVGEHGERVMVRVGGGWADLAEYLREYSLHHGHRGLANDSLEVANFPTPPSGRNEGSRASMLYDTPSRSRSNSANVQDSAKHRSFPSASTQFDDAPELVVVKTRKGAPSTTSHRNSMAHDTEWVPPPVPPIPKTYSVSSPTMVTSTSNGFTTTAMMQPFNASSLKSNFRASSNPVYTSQSSDGRVQSSTSINLGSSPGSAKYVPLGAGGPKSNGRRSGAQNLSPVPHRESWVEGMVGKARAVSGGSTVIYGPTTTTTTTVVSRSGGVGRRVSALARLSGTNISTEKSFGGTRNTSSSVSPDSSSTGINSPVNGAPAESAPVRTRSRLSFGDVGGIKRVFLRRKNDK